MRCYHVERCGEVSTGYGRIILVLSKPAKLKTCKYPQKSDNRNNYNSIVGKEMGLKQHVLAPSMRVKSTEIM